nr:hypothetical protein [Candidatus Njordarchaeum guaymaensis]
MYRASINSIARRSILETLGGMEMYRKAAALLAVAIWLLLAISGLRTCFIVEASRQQVFVGASIVVVKDDVFSYVRTAYSYETASSVTHFVDVSGGEKYNVTCFPAHWSFERIEPKPRLLVICDNSLRFLGDRNKTYRVYWFSNEFYQPVIWKDDSFSGEWSSYTWNGWPERKHFDTDGDILTMFMTHTGGLETRDEDFGLYKDIPTVNISKPLFLLFRYRVINVSSEDLLLNVKFQDTSSMWFDVWATKRGELSSPSSWKQVIVDLSSLPISNISRLYLRMDSLTSGASFSVQWDYLMFARNFERNRARVAIANGGFERGDISDWKASGGAEGIVTSNVVYEGSCALKIFSGAYTQTLSNVSFATFSVYLVSGQAELIVSSGDKRLYYVFSKDGRPHGLAESTNDKLASCIPSDNNWASASADFAQDWQEGFKENLPESWTLSIGLEGRGEVFFDGINYPANYDLTAAVKGSREQSLEGSLVKLSLSNGTVYDIEATDRYGNVTFVQIREGNYVLTAEYKGRIVEREISVPQDLSTKLVVDVYADVLGLPVTAMQTLVLAELLVIMSAIAVVVSFKRIERRSQGH